MIHLSIECSTGVLGLALMEDDRVLGMTSLSAVGAASEILPQSVGLLLEAAKKKPTEIKMVSVSKGPGSYSSLRVAHSFGSGLSLGLSVSLVSVSPFDTLALQWKDLRGKSVLLVVDARQSEVVGELRVRDPASGEWILDPFWPVSEKPVAIEFLLEGVSGAEVAGPGVIHLPGDSVQKWPSLSFPSGTGVPPDPACQGRVALLGGAHRGLVYGRPAVGG